MNPWDIDPNLYLPLYRALYRAIYRAMSAPLRPLLRRRQLHSAAKPAGCRG